MGRRYGQAMGNEVGRAYTSAAAIIVESMLISTLTGIAYIITFARGDQVEIFFLSIYVMSTVSCKSDNGVEIWLEMLMILGRAVHCATAGRAAGCGGPCVDPGKDVYDPV